MWAYAQKEEKEKIGESLLFMRTTLRASRQEVKKNILF